MKAGEFELYDAHRFEQRQRARAAASHWMQFVDRDTLLVLARQALEGYLANCPITAAQHSDLIAAGCATETEDESIQAVVGRLDLESVITGLVILDHAYDLKILPRI